ncbi:MAG: secretin N-terminal domain-containing protein [Pyrinomonadaceae bacterium]
MILTLILFMIPTVLGQTAQTTAKTSGGADNTVTERSLKNRIFEIKHGDPEKLLDILRTLGSGSAGASISASRGFKTIAVRDFPENIAVIEDALKRLDVAEAPRFGVELHVYALIASSDASGQSDYPPELSDVIKQLQSTLKYKHYNIMMSSTQRIQEGSGDISDNKGVIENKVFGAITQQESKPFYQYNIRSLNVNGTTSDVSSTATSVPIIQIGRFSFDLRLPINAIYTTLGFNTPVSLHEGEKVVVGTTTLEDKGLIVVLSAKIIR